MTLSPTVPSTGAGIGTLAPIPEVPAGDVDLIAPLGTIDAGEAGIRVGQRQHRGAARGERGQHPGAGREQGHPGDGLGQHRRPVQRQRGGLHGHGGGAGRDAARPRASRQNLPSIISVQILGYGDEQLPAGRAPASPSVDAGKQAPIYRADSVFQMVGDGPLTPVQQAALTPAERRNWQP